MHPTNPQELIIRVGRRIAELRKARGITQADLAERMRCSVQYVGLLERGKQNLTITKMAEIAAVLGATFDDLTRKPRRRSLKIRRGRPRKDQ